MNRNPQTESSDEIKQQSLYQEQQVLLFWLLSKILRRLARRIAWAELSAPDKRRLNTTLKTLESDVRLVRTVISAQPTHSKGFARTVKKAKGDGGHSQIAQGN